MLFILQLTSHDLHEHVERLCHFALKAAEVKHSLVTLKTVETFVDV